MKYILVLTVLCWPLGVCLLLKKCYTQRVVDVTMLAALFAEFVALSFWVINRYQHEGDVFIWTAVAWVITMAHWLITLLIIRLFERR